MRTNSSCTRHAARAARSIRFCTRRRSRSQSTARDTGPTAGQPKYLATCSELTQAGPPGGGPGAGEPSRLNISGPPSEASYVHPGLHLADAPLGEMPLLPALAERDTELPGAPHQCLIRVGLAEVGLCPVENLAVQGIFEEQFNCPVRFFGSQGHSQVDQRMCRYVKEGVAGDGLIADLPAVVRSVSPQSAPIVTTQNRERQLAAQCTLPLRRILQRIAFITDRSASRRTPEAGTRIGPRRRDQEPVCRAGCELNFPALDRGIASVGRDR